ncbi:HD domain-containing phosphohydrolase [Desulfocurvibacter africanus]|uniref:Metal dependent phosphohydrolase n=1 Tax=Desulfocurvibacter africanus subsp. africanus str. Walvis Bay TaxID=690850 RepID=F3YUJ1_DESAF|nr:HD domain-containing phosphohydrolase [Desulfocurvibacter africanus]EGJ48945.1 metal dependent phosphohydrolase [Desulfocurvibacter africanus subsp. africanus str. Walvis Bay]
MLYAPNRAPSAKEPKPLFFPVSPFLLFSGIQATFRVYLRQNGKYVLYTREEDRLQDTHRQKLFDMGVRSVYVLSEQKEAYESYLEEHLDAFLDNETIPSEQRAETFHSLSSGIVEEFFEHRLPTNAGGPIYDRVQKLVRSSVRFLSKSDSLRDVSRLITHTYKTYAHCLHVFIYATAIYSTMSGMDEEALVRNGLGALLHDIGKTRIDKAVLDKPGKLTDAEWAGMRQHPMHGAAICSNLPLAGDTINCILFHHERFDGGGYPAGLVGEAIPLAVRVVTVCDVYDALTSDRAYAPAVTPFEALSIMRDQMADHFDMEIYRRLVLVLSGAKVV